MRTPDQCSGASNDEPIVRVNARNSRSAALRSSSTGAPPEQARCGRPPAEIGGPLAPAGIAAASSAFRRRRFSKLCRRADSKLACARCTISDRRRLCGAPAKRVQGNHRPATATGDRGPSPRPRLELSPDRVPMASSANGPCDPATSLGVDQHRPALPDDRSVAQRSRVASKVPMPRQVDHAAATLRRPSTSSNTRSACGRPALASRLRGLLAGDTSPRSPDAVGTRSRRRWHLLTRRCCHSSTMRRPSIRICSAPSRLFGGHDRAEPPWPR